MVGKRKVGIKNKAYIFGLTYNEWWSHKLKWGRVEKGKVWWWLGCRWGKFIFMLAGAG